MLEKKDCEIKWVKSYIWTIITYMDDKHTYMDDKHTYMDDKHIYGR